MSKILSEFRDKFGTDEGNPFKSEFNLTEKTITLLLFCSASVAIIVSAAIIYTLVEGSLTFFTDPLVNIIEFLTGSKWVPSGSNPRFGILPLVFHS